MTLLANMRALMAAVQPATGNRATGAVQFYSATGTVNVPLGTYALPVIGYTGITGVTGLSYSLDPTRPVKVAGGGASGLYAAGTTGMAVPMLSNLGGTRYNFLPETKFLLDPPVAGVTGFGLCPSGFAGGVDANGFGAIKEFVLAENLSGTDWNVDLQRIRLRALPAVVLTWRNLTQSDGSTSPQTLSQSRMGSTTKLMRAGYTLSVICARNDTQPWRSMEGYAIIDALLGLLSDREAVDGEALSHPSGVQIEMAQRAGVAKVDAQRVIIYTLNVSTTFAVTKCDARRFADWLRSHLMVDISVGPDVPEGDPRLVNMLIDMRPLNLENGEQQVTNGGENVIG